jgi:hypothetical protein
MLETAEEKEETKKGDESLKLSFIYVMRLG